MYLRRRKVVSMCLCRSLGSHIPSWVGIGFDGPFHRMPPKSQSRLCRCSVLYSLASSHIVMCVDMLLYMLRRDRKPSAVLLKIPCDSVVWVPMMVRMDVKLLSMQLIREIGR
jgi:hypothetical protein